MNRTYSIVWSAVRNMYVVASELARGHSKVKIQAHANEVAPSIKKPDSGWAMSAKHHALILAIVAALGFASPLAIADNPVSYIDGVDHDLSADSPIRRFPTQAPVKVPHCTSKAYPLKARAGSPLQPLARISRLERTAAGPPFRVAVMRWLQRFRSIGEQHLN